MKFCPKCGKDIPENIKFCPYCGYRVIQEQQESSSEENRNFVSLNEAEDISTKKKIDKNLLYKILLFFVLLLAGSILFVKYSNPTNTFSKTEEIKKIVGEWYDPTGVIISKGNRITLTQQGDDIVGTNRKENISIRITPIGKNHYRGHLIIKGVDSKNDVKYDKENGKLIFTNRLLKSSISFAKK